MKKIIIRIGVVGIICLIVLVVVLTMSLGSINKKGVETVGPQITKTEMKLEETGNMFIYSVRLPS